MIKLRPCRREPSQRRKRRPTTRSAPREEWQAARIELVKLEAEQTEPDQKVTEQRRQLPGFQGPRLADPGPGGESVYEAVARYAQGYRAVAGRPESVVPAVCHELPIRFALNAASGSEGLERPKHEIANADPYLFEHSTLERAGDGIMRQRVACPTTPRRTRPDRSEPR